MLLFGWFVIATRSRATTWGRYSVAVGLVLVAMSISHALDDGDLTNLLLLAAGVALPMWLLWLTRLLHQVASSKSGSTTTWRTSDFAKQVSP